MSFLFFLVFIIVSCHGQKKREWPRAYQSSKGALEKRKVYETREDRPWLRLFVRPRPSLSVVDPGHTAPRTTRTQRGAKKRRGRQTQQRASGKDWRGQRRVNGSAPTTPPDKQGTLAHHGFGRHARSHHRVVPAPRPRPTRPCPKQTGVAGRPLVLGRRRRVRTSGAACVPASRGVGHLDRVETAFVGRGARDRGDCGGAARPARTGTRRGGSRVETVRASVCPRRSGRLESALVDSVVRVDRRRSSRGVRSSFCFRARPRQCGARRAGGQCRKGARRAQRHVCIDACRHCTRPQ